MCLSETASFTWAFRWEDARPLLVESLTELGLQEREIVLEAIFRGGRGLEESRRIKMIILVSVSFSETQTWLFLRTQVPRSNGARVNYYSAFEGHSDFAHLHLARKIFMLIFAPP